MDSAVNLLVMFAVVVPLLLAVFSKSYLLFGFLILVIVGMNGAYDVGGFTQFLTVVLLIIVWRIIHKRRRYARAERETYRDGRATAKWAKVFNRGYDDEYYN